jgi:hypothetical protein
MATIDIWIQLENHRWDVAPSLPLDRVTSSGTTSGGPLRKGADAVFSALLPPELVAKTVAAK